MKQFNEIFGKVMIEVTPTEVAMLGTDVPVVTVGGHTYADFVTWANKSFSPHLMLGEYAWFTSDRVKARILGNFTPKCASALKANGFDDYTIYSDSVYEEDGKPIGDSLYLAIPYV